MYGQGVEMSPNEKNRAAGPAHQNAQEAKTADIRTRLRRIAANRKRILEIEEDTAAETRQVAKLITDAMPIGSQKERLFVMIYKEAASCGIKYVSMNELAAIHRGNNGNRKLFEAAPGLLRDLGEHDLLILLGGKGAKDTLVRLLEPLATEVMDILSKNRDRNSTNAERARGLARKDG